MYRTISILSIINRATFRLSAKPLLNRSLRYADSFSLPAFKKLKLHFLFTICNILDTAFYPQIHVTCFILKTYPDSDMPCEFRFFLCIFVVTYTLFICFRKYNTEYAKYRLHYFAIGIIVFLYDLFVFIYCFVIKEVYFQNGNLTIYYKDNIFKIL